MIRQAYISTDMQKVIVAFLKSFQTASPWNRWAVIYGWPEVDRFELQELFVFVMPPKYLSNTIKSQGASIDLGRWSVRIGAWDNRVKGGAEEIQIAQSQILYAFRNKAYRTSQTFDVTTDAAYTATNLTAQGIQVEGIEGPFFILDNTQENELRCEFDLYLKG